MYLGCFRDIERAGLKRNVQIVSGAGNAILSLNAIHSNLYHVFDSFVHLFVIDSPAKVLDPAIQGQVMGLSLHQPKFATIQPRKQE